MLSVFIAFVLSFIAPGMGQVFAEKYLFGLCLAFFFVFARPVILPLLIRLIAFKQEVKMLKFIYAFNMFFNISLFITILDACYTAYHLQSVNFAAAGYGFLIALVLNGAARSLRSEFIIYALSGRNDISKYIFVKNRNKK